MRNIVNIRIGESHEIRPLRYKVLWPHLKGIEFCQIPPDEEPSTFHVVAELENKIVGIVTFIVDINDRFTEKSQFRLRAMATHPTLRGYGIGTDIIDFGIKELKKQNIKLLWCDARLIATGFYERQAFKIKGEVYQVPKIGPHKLMYKEL